MFKLNNLKSPAGSNQKKKRKGLGIGSGLGKTAGRGHKGQLARSGGGISARFEGGQIPVQRRSPKVGFRSPLKYLKVTLNITGLGQFTDRDLKLKDLAPKSQASYSRLFVTVVGTKVPKKGFPKSIEAHKVAPAAKLLLEKAGVGITLVPYLDGARSVRPVKVKKKA